MIKRKYGERAQLLFTDTDSLMYEIDTADVYEDMMEQKELYDLSDYKHESPYYFAYNKKEIGKFKDEAVGDPVVEFVGLKPKMYSFTKAKVEANGDYEIIEKHTAKGIQKCAAERLKHEAFKAQLATPTENYVVNRRLGSRLHEIYSIAVFAQLLSLFTPIPS